MEWWLEQYAANRLNLDPPFQRRSELWSKFKRAHLIDSVLNGYDVPKFYVADFTLGRSSLNEDHKPYAVVDGKQRFNAFFSFMLNAFPINGSSILEEDVSRSIKGLTFNELLVQHSDLAARILQFRPVVMSIITDDDHRIAEMFVRLNSGEAANSAERRNAQPGPIPELARELVMHPFFRNRISFTTKRMADHQLATKLLMMEHYGSPVDTKASNMDRFVRVAASEVGSSPFDEPTQEQKAALAHYEQKKDAVVQVLEFLSEVFRPRDPLLSASGRVPVYYWVLRKHPALASNFRDFVEDFEEKVLGAMRMARDRSGFPDQELLNYYTLSRTSNDQHSVRGRVQTMEDALRKRRLI